MLAALAPTFLAFVLFTLSGYERYSSRYFSFSVGPLAVLIVLGIYEVLSLVGRALHFVKPAVVLVLTAVIGALLAYPGGLYALQKPKQDWRGIAAAIVERIEKEPTRRSWSMRQRSKGSRRSTTISRRFSDDIRVDQIFQKELEKESGPVAFSPPDADYVVVAFTHQKVRDWPKTRKAFGSNMTLVEEKLDKDGRGYLVYAVPQ